LPKFVRYMEKEHPEVELDIRCLEYGELIRAHRMHNVDVIFNMDFDPEAVDACDSERIYSGTCRIACEDTILKKWENPQPGMGVMYRFG